MLPTPASAPVCMAAVSYHTVEAWFRRRRRVMGTGAAAETA